MKKSTFIILSALFAAGLLAACSSDTSIGPGKPGTGGSGGASGGNGDGGATPSGGAAGDSGGSAGTNDSGGSTGAGGGNGADDSGAGGPGTDSGEPPGDSGSAGGSNFTLGSGNPNSTGLDRHDAIYCGEWQKTTKPGDTIYLIKGGKVAWTHSLHTSGGDEYGDCTMLSNGNVVFNLKATGAQEIKPDLVTGSEGEIVWRYDEDSGTEVHAVQPIGLDKVLVMQNGDPAKLMLINKTTAKVCHSGDPCVEKTWNPTAGGGVHGMFRHVRMTKEGNLLVPYHGGGGPALHGHVVEYTQDWQVVWDYDTKGTPWAAVRLKNGNTLISGNQGEWFREVTHDMPPVVKWEMTWADFQAEGQTTPFLAQGAVRLANGNTIVGLWCGSPVPNTADWPKTDQYWEITPEKKAVWKVRSWTMPNLGPGSFMQALDDPGIPENVGDLQR